MNPAARMAFRVPRGHWFAMAWLIVCLLANIAVAAGTPNDSRVLLIVWDGLRPDMVSAADTPNLARLQAGGVEFADHHSTYPTLTMINASSFATGAYPGTHGFYGNWIWVPKANGRDSSDRIVDFQQPVFTEDYAILQAIDAAEAGRLFSVPTVFEAAARAGLNVALLGKGGPTFVQNRRGTVPFIDDKTVMPQSFAQALANASVPIPKLWRNAYPADPDTNFSKSDDPTAISGSALMKHGAIADPTRTDVQPFVSVNAYHARVLTDYVLPTLKPRLAMLWLRNPDSTEHTFGPGSAAAHQALRSTDAILGGVLTRLDELGLSASTNIMIVSDHGHSHVSGSLDYFPLRAVNNGAVGDIDANGYSVSGDVRTVDLLRRAGLLAYDGMREQCNSVLSGIGRNGLSMYLHKPIDAQFVCNPNIVTTGDFTVPGKLPAHTPYAVVAPDGGSEYVYVPSHDATFVEKLVRFFQSRPQYGAVFIDSKRYGRVSGALPLSVVRLANAEGRNPDLIVSFNFDADARISGLPGIEYSSSYVASNRGTHGSFSPRDVHNVLIANGPAFKPDFHRDELPSANVDVAPTIAAILGLRLPSADGRALYEALRDSKNKPQLLRQEVLRPEQPAMALKIVGPDDPDGAVINTAVSNYTIELHTKLVRDGKREYRYFDSAQALRY